MDFKASSLIETAMTSGTVGGAFVTAGPAAGEPFYWQVSQDSKKRWTKSGLKVKPRTKAKTAADDERERRKWLKQFALLSLYRRENFLSLNESSYRPSGSHGYSTTGLDHVSTSAPQNNHRRPVPGDAETVVTPITNKGNTKPEDMFLTDKEKMGSHLLPKKKEEEKGTMDALRGHFASMLKFGCPQHQESVLDRLPHSKKDIEDLGDEDWKAIQKVQNTSTDDPFWVWKRRLRYAGALKNYKEGDEPEFAASPLIERS